MPTHNLGAATVDADAVCEVCGTVNAEGVLICRTCGNNLRDQKSRRLAAEAQLFEPERVNSSQYIRGALAIIALVIILWTAINVNKIADRIVNAGGSGDPIRAYFEPPLATYYDTLALEALALAPSAEQVEALMVEPIPATTLDGNYVLVQNDPYSGLAILGTAVVRTDATGTHYLASLGALGQVRGIVRSQGESAFSSAWNDAAAQSADGTIFGVAGVAVAQQDGSVECFGQSALDDASYEVVAYRLP
jgi:hypothetical protein